MLLGMYFLAMKKTPITHGGKREGAGRKPASEPTVFIKKFRASKLEQIKFKMYMTGDARKDFLLVLRALDFLSIEEFVRQQYT